MPGQYDRPLHEWLTAARERLAASVGDDRATYDLTDEDVRALLDLARVAAHDSGDRTNAPLLCFLVGLALGRHPDSAIAELSAAAAVAPGAGAETS